MRRAAAASRWLLAIVAVIAGCATQRQEFFAPVLAPDAESAFRELTRIRVDFPGARSYARLKAVSGERRQSFNARIAIDRSGRARIDGLTPIGTAAMTLWSDGQQVVFMDHLNEIFWTGSTRQLSEPLRVMIERGAFLLAGLPVDDPSIIYQTKPTGLASAEVSGVRFTYTPPQFPPRRIVIEAGSDRLEVEHAEFTSGSEPLEPPPIEAGYRRGNPPSLLPPPRG